ncbi:MAG: alpha/beta fold hydrolase [Candidatus Thorarchaeota archaeon]
MPEHYADLDGIKICYEVNGKGYPVILVNGFGSKKEGWMGQVPVLSKKFKVITFDCRGSGKSDRPDMPYTMEMFADDIKNLMEYLNIQKAHFVGFSLGGMILQNFALKYPERINKLVLINSLSKIPEGYGPEMYINSHLKGLELLKQDSVKAFWHGAKTGFHVKFRKEMGANPKKKFYGLWSVEDLIDYYSTNPPTPKDIENMANALSTHHVYERLSEIKHKTLVLAASHDKLVPRSVMENLHNQLSNSIFKIIEESGHESPKEKAPDVNKEIIEFLS